MMDDKIEVIGYHTYDFGTVPIYRTKDTGIMGNADTMALLTRMVNELKAENEMLKQQLIFKNAGSRTSGLASQISAVESGNVVPR